MTEYHCLKDSVIPSKIFEAGLKRFPEEVEFAAQYLSYLISINDDSSEFLTSLS